MATIVVYGGGFQPFHVGHLSSYLQAKKAFPNAAFYVAASNDTKQRPIPFQDKQFLAQQAGVKDPFVETRNPINPVEILSQYNPEKDVYVIVRSERDPMPYTKKDGSPAYYQPYVPGEPMEPFGKHGYVLVTKKHTFMVGGQEIYSGTQVRDMYSSADDKGKLALIKELYPNSKQQLTIKKMLDKYLGAPAAPQVATGSAMKKLKDKQLAEQISKIRPLLKEASPAQKLKLMQLMKSALTESRIMDRDAMINAYYVSTKGQRHKVAENIPYYLLDKLVPLLTKKYAITMNDIEVRPADQSQYRRTSQPELAETEQVDRLEEELANIKREMAEAYDHNAPFNAADFNRHMEQLRAREELRKTDPVKALVGDLIDKDNAARNVKKKPQDDSSMDINDPRHPGWGALHNPLGEDDRDGMKDGRPYSDPLRRHPGNESYMTPDYLIQKYTERLAQIAAGPYKRPKEVAQLKSRIAKLQGQQGVDEGSEEALQYATQAHAGQTRSGGDPYITHPMRVADHIRKYKQSHNLDALISAAYLHDTIEDTDTTQEVLHDLFGGLVASLVKELTSDPAQIKKMGKAAYLSHKMAVMSSYGLVIKLADRLDNVKDITTAKTPEWRHKYAAETNQILDYIEKTRALSGTHKKLISLIRAKLAEIDNPPQVADEGISRRGILKGIAGAGALGAAGKASAIAGAFPTPSHQAAMYKAAADSNAAQARADAAAKAKADAQRLQQGTGDIERLNKINYHGNKVTPTNAEWDGDSDFMDLDGTKYSMASRMPIKGDEPRDMKLISTREGRQVYIWTRYRMKGDGGHYFYPAPANTPTNEDYLDEK